MRCTLFLLALALLPSTARGSGGATSPGWTGMRTSDANASTAPGPVLFASAFSSAQNTGDGQLDSQSESKIDSGSQGDSDSQGESDGQGEKNAEPYRPPGAAAMRNVVLPGWGQHFNGQSGKGWVFTFMWGIGLLLATETISSGSLQGASESNDIEKAIGFAMLGIAYGGSILDAHSTAKRLNTENGYDLSQRAPPEPRFTVLALRF